MERALRIPGLLHGRCSMVSGMAGAAIFRPLNDMMGDPNLDDYRTAATAANGARSSLEAVETVRVLERQADNVVAEARAVLGAMPRAVDQAILGALRGAFADGAPIHLAWEETADAGAAITCDISVENGRVRIVVRSADGTNYL